MKLAATPPAVVKPPPAYSAGPLPSSNTVSANTEANSPFIPLPRWDHCVPSHLAMKLNLSPPMWEKTPPTYSAEPLLSSNTVSAFTEALTPLPSADHCVPFHLAMLLTTTPPARVKPPPAYSAGPLPSSKTVSADRSWLIPLPLPIADHCMPSHLAM